MAFILLFTASLSIASPLPVAAMREMAQATAPASDHITAQIIRAPDWNGAEEFHQEDCKAEWGLFARWVYASGLQCGVSREEADRVLLRRLPTLAVAPLTTVTEVPGGRYAAWVYGAGDPGNPLVRLCAKTCVKGTLPPTPEWTWLGWIETRDNQSLYIRTWKFPVNDTMYIQEVVLSSSDVQPDWVP